MKDVKGVAVPRGRIAHAELLAVLERGYQRLEQWSSRTARFARFSPVSGAGLDLVIKVCERWDAENAEVSVDHALEWAPLGAGGRARVVTFLAWCAEPPTLVSEHVGGEELRDYLRDSAGREAADSVRLLASIGALLAAIHRIEPAKSSWRGKRRRHRVVCAGDFAVYNFRLGEAGEAVYLEPPAARQVVSRFRDLAWFLASLRLRLVRSNPERMLLSRAFLEGYRSVLGPGWSSCATLSLRVALFRRETLQTLRRWRRRWRVALGVLRSRPLPAGQVPEATAKARKSGADSSSSS